VSIYLVDAIEALASHHDRSQFCCGDQEPDTYLKRFARQHASARVSRTYVAVKGTTILGFYCLAMAAIRKDHLPPIYRTKFPNFPLPVARLARLAVDLKFQRQGVGELLLANALSRCLDLSDEIGMVGVIVDAKNETAQRFYERFEFDLLVDSPLTLWIPFSALTQLK
jgi:GNAT superfamily N-acetyltransferase